MSNREIGPGQARITLEVPAQYAAPVTDYLSSLTLNSNVAVEYGPPAEEAIKAEHVKNGLKFNPHLSALAQSPSSETPVAIVTRDHFVSYSKQVHGSGTAVMSKLFGQLVRACAYDTVSKGSTVRPERLKDSIFDDHDRISQSHQVGLLAERIPEFIELLESGQLKIRGLGDFSIYFLKQFCHELNKPPAPD